MATRREPATLPAEPPDSATVLTREGETIAEAKARHRRFYEKLMALRGKVKFDIDLDELRGRNRH
ncbi:MAG TPA: hypothetical protein VG323_19535 [Thermoanaerobaculia bacterium]|nr:hypothetical protein [Thermoanaerobaculia bacterium]